LEDRQQSRFDHVFIEIVRRKSPLCLDLCRSMVLFMIEKNLVNGLNCMLRKATCFRNEDIIEFILEQEYVKNRMVGPVPTIKKWPNAIALLRSVFPTKIFKDFLPSDKEISEQFEAFPTTFSVWMMCHDTRVLEEAVSRYNFKPTYNSLMLYLIHGFDPETEIGISFRTLRKMHPKNHLQMILKNVKWLCDHSSPDTNADKETVAKVFKWTYGDCFLDVIAFVLKNVNQSYRDAMITSLQRKGRTHFYGTFHVSTYQRFMSI
jgi:hypothetical protein